MNLFRSSPSVIRFGRHSEESALAHFLQSDILTEGTCRSELLQTIGRGHHTGMGHPGRRRWLRFGEASLAWLRVAGSVGVGFVLDRRRKREGHWVRLGEGLAKVVGFVWE